MGGGTGQSDSLRCLCLATQGSLLRYVSPPTSLVGHLDHRLNLHCHVEREGVDPDCRPRVLAGLAKHLSGRMAVEGGKKNGYE
jgi:hypothetical protein